jgi:hypothetical protein
MLDLIVGSFVRSVARFVAAGAFAVALGQPHKFLIPPQRGGMSPCQLKPMRPEAQADHPPP